MNVRLFRRAAIAASLALVFACSAMKVAGAAPFSFDTAFGRLPKNVVPIDYTIAVVPNAMAHTLTGRESIVLNVRSATRTIEFNTLNETVTNARVDGAAVASIKTVNDAQLTTLSLAKPLAPGHHTLTFAYTGVIETSPQGLFAQPYQKPGGGSGVMLSTQFESTDARRMFPCWDEPAFRATYQLSVTVPAKWMAVSNMPVSRRVVNGALATTSFARTPKMPSYLVEYSAGDLSRITASSNGTTFGVVAVSGQENGGAYALANAQQILADYNDYFGHRFPLPKLDSIAVPGGFQGAMENWGAITYNDQTLLLNASSTQSAKQTVYGIQAHEMAHQWNGDLVTMGWWDDIWLNESFASWMAAKETDLRNPTWNVLENEDASKERAMGADARLTSHPIQVHIADELQSENAFDSEITYSKGQAFLRMLESYLGESTFRDGVRHYIAARAFSNATGDDLWNALSAASGQDVAALARPWIEQAGFPLVSVSASCDASNNRTIALSQQRFLLSGSDPKTSRWVIPLDIRSSAAGTPTRLLLTSDGQTVAAGKCGDPLSVNADTIGFYRVAYDATTLAVNQKNFDSLRNGDRIALLDDQWALVQAGKAPLPSFLGLATSMGGDNDARAWNQISDVLSRLEIDERGTPGYDAFLTYARSVMKPLSTRLGPTAKPDETLDVRGLRRTAIADLGEWGDPEVVADAKKRFAAFMADRSTISPDDQDLVLSIVAANADAATFEQLHTLAKSSKNETELRRYYGALAGVRDPALATKAMEIALSPEIAPQAATMRLEIVAGTSDYNPQLSYQFFTKNYDELMKPLGPSGPGLMAQAVPQAYWRAVPIDELTAFVKSKVPAEMAPFVAKGVERARFSADQKKTMVPATDTYVRSQTLLLQK